MDTDVSCDFLDNIFVERLWRSMKYECVYLHAWETGSEAREGIRKWMTFYNHQRPHSALGGKPPALVYWQRNDINQPDQQEQRVAEIAPDPVQRFGSSSPFSVRGASRTRDNLFFRQSASLKTEFNGHVVALHTTAYVAPTHLADDGASQLVLLLQGNGRMRFIARSIKSV